MKHRFFATTHLTSHALHNILLQVSKVALPTSHRRDRKHRRRSEWQADMVQHTSYVNPRVTLCRILPSANQFFVFTSRVVHLRHIHLTVFLHFISQPYAIHYYVLLWWYGNRRLFGAHDSLWRGGRFDSRPFHLFITTLGKLFTHACLRHQAV